ncbi:MAG TPA: hypothetical protein VFE20_01050 [Thermoleophilia bacterium]|nr:hypothetical protein [Thermoleophilia bacterium]
MSDCPTNPVDLPGHFFHTLHDNGAIKYQGQVVGRIEPGLFLVELFSYNDGLRTHRQVVPVSDMTGWRFYPSAEEMIDYHERVTR